MDGDSASDGSLSYPFYRDRTAASQQRIVEGLGEVLHRLQNDNLIPLGGMVLRENYEQALRVSHAVKEMFVDMVGSESQRALHSRIWPYQDQES